MATIKPFKAIRPTRDKVGLFATRTYLSYSKKGLNEKLLNNPYTFLQIINPDFNKNIKLKGEEKFKLIKKKFKSFIEQNIIIKDKKDAFYIYSLNHEGNEYKGLIATSSTEEYDKGIIKKHEKTIEKRENLFTNYLSKIRFNADPVLLSYKSNNKINKLINNFSNCRAEYEFTTSNKALHKLWVISDPINISKIVDEFKKIKSLYIADGHHRSASSLRLSKKNGPNNFMSFLIDEKQINIYSFNRIIKNIKNIDTENLINKLSNKFIITKIKSPEFQSYNDNEIIVYFKKIMLSIKPKKGSYEENSLSKLSYSILNKNIIQEILYLDDNSDKIKYINGKHKPEEIINLIDKEKNSIAFILKPIKIEEIRKIADQNLALPPKSTYIEPKLRSGITILDLK